MRGSDRQASGSRQSERKNLPRPNPSLAASISPPGVGDDTLGLLLSVGADDTYAEARKRMLMCAATSLREVYDAGPQAHGAPGVFSGAFPRESFDFSTECWSQRATNASMYGSVAPLRISYEPASGGQDAMALFGIANKQIVPRIAQRAQLPNQSDGDAFVRRVTTRMTLDAVRVTTAYALNMIEGGESANQSAVGTGTSLLATDDGDSDISFMGVPPSGPLPETPPLPYLDVATPPVPESVSPQYYFTQHMFWRSHIKDICAQDGLLQSLRDKCVSAASLPGGDPDSCTACVEVAEMHMPTAWTEDIVQTQALGPSKCAALGFPGGGGLPDVYLSYDKRVGTADDSGVARDDSTILNYPPYFPAFGYCTGTVPNQNNASLNPFVEHPGSLWRRAVVDQTVTRTIDCNSVPGQPDLKHDFHSNHYRLGAAINEASTTAVFGWPAFDPVWVPPLISATEGAETETLLDQTTFCNPVFKSGVLVALPTTYGWRTDDTTDSVVQSSLGAAPFWDSQSEGNPALPKYSDQESVDQLRVGVCGLAQRVSYHNRSCATALNGINRTDLLAIVDTGYQPSTGAEVISSSAAENTPRCSVREPRTILQCAAGACGADGLCSALGKPKVTVFHPGTP